MWGTTFGVVRIKLIQCDPRLCFSMLGSHRLCSEIHLVKGFDFTVFSLASIRIMTGWSGSVVSFVRKKPRLRRNV